MGTNSCEVSLSAPPQVVISEPESRIQECFRNRDNHFACLPDSLLPSLITEGAYFVGALETSNLLLNSQRRPLPSSCLCLHRLVFKRCKRGVEGGSQHTQVDQDSGTCSLNQRPGCHGTAPKWQADPLGHSNSSYQQTPSQINQSMGFLLFFFFFFFLLFFSSSLPSREVLQSHPSLLGESHVAL